MAALGVVSARGGPAGPRAETPFCAASRLHLSLNAGSMYMNANRVLDSRLSVVRTGPSRPNCRACALPPFPAHLTESPSDDTPFDVIPATPLPAFLRLKMKSFYPEILEIACDRLIYVAKHTGARVRGPVFLPIERKLYTVLTSPHVNKSAREQFEKKRRTRLLDVHHPTPATMAALATLEMPLGLTLWVLTPDDAYDLGDSSRRRRLRDARRILGLEEIAEDGVDEHEEDALGGVLDDEAGE